MTDFVSGQAEEILICLGVLQFIVVQWYNVGDVVRKTDFVACQ